MKRVIIAIFLTAALFVLSVDVFAGDYVDDMSEITASPYVSYTNLVLPGSALSRYLALDLVPDDSCIMMSSGAASAWVDYIASGVSRVTVSFYAARGLYATYFPDTDCYRIQNNEVQAGDREVLLDPITGSSCVYDGSSWYYQGFFPSDNDVRFTKIPGLGSKGNTAKSSGVNLYTSVDGKAFTPVPFRITSVLPASQICSSGTSVYAEGTAEVSAGVRYIRIEMLRPQVMFENGSADHPLPIQMLSSVYLASMRLSGSAVTLGGTAPKPSAADESSPDTDKPNALQNAGGGSAAKKSVPPDYDYAPYHSDGTGKGYSNNQSKSGAPGTDGPNEAFDSVGYAAASFSQKPNAPQAGGNSANLTGSLIIEPEKEAFVDSSDTQKVIIVAFGVLGVCAITYSATIMTKATRQNKAKEPRSEPPEEE